MNEPNIETSDVEAILWRHNTERLLRKSYEARRATLTCERKMISFKRNWNRVSYQQLNLIIHLSAFRNFDREKREVVRTRLQVGCHGNEVAFTFKTFSFQPRQICAFKLFFVSFTMKGYGSFVYYCDVTLIRAWNSTICWTSWL